MMKTAAFWRRRVVAVCVVAVALAAALAAGEHRRRSLVERNFRDTRGAPPRGPVEALPLAKQLCDALHALPGRRTAECCEAPPSKYLYDECVDVVSRSLASGAIALDADAVTECERAMSAQLAGCDWVRPGLPLAPAACQGLVQGRVASGGACRSSLECGSNLHCVAAPGAAQGRCAPAASLGATCGRSTDALAAYVLERSSDIEHPVCADFCSLVSHQCELKPKEGAACRANTNCASGQQCTQGACRSGVIALELSSTGQPCRTDFECARGGCVASGASGGGVCGKRCSTRVPD